MVLLLQAKIFKDRGFRKLRSAYMWLWKFCLSDKYLKSNRFEMQKGILSYTQDQNLPIQQFNDSVHSVHSAHSTC